MCRRRNMLCARRMFGVQFAKVESAPKSIELNQLLLDGRPSHLRERVRPCTMEKVHLEQILLTHRESWPGCLSCLEDMFDGAVQNFTLDHGHGGTKKDCARVFLKNWSTQFGAVRPRRSNGWGGRNAVKGTGRGARQVGGTTARGGGAAPSRTTEIVGGLALKQTVHGTDWRISSSSSRTNCKQEQNASNTSGPFEKRETLFSLFQHPIGMSIVLDDLFLVLSVFGLRPLYSHLPGGIWRRMGAKSRHNCGICNGTVAG
ncbi:hypothetical protein niasHT_025307 [Heterodera trifolii]|uniref:Uncharacterized protein n=1 Tax=Heterodera trifolii TaxID=157864 RepID=A0ABD2KKH3_9BILA